MDHVKLVEDPIDITHIHQLLADEGCGASSVFVGTTRDNFQGKKVVSLAYEAYDNMALKEMNKICSDLRSKWPELRHIVVYHRLGTVPVCEASVVIAASSPHRSEALESVSFAIDQLKTRVPIWKKEIYEGDHNSEWKENKESFRPKKSVSNFNYLACPCKVEESPDDVPPQKLVQIRVNDAELAKRVECFVNSKRAEINSQNVIDFKASSSAFDTDKDPSDSCARTQSTIIKQEQSNCHLKVRRVNNRSGPQQMAFRPNYELELNKLMGSRDLGTDPSTKMKQSLHNSRLQTIELYMGLAAAASSDESIFSRIKNVEDRILQLEAISPEYRHFTNLEPSSSSSPASWLEPPNPKKSRKKSYSAQELGAFIQKLKDGGG